MENKKLKKHRVAIIVSVLLILIPALLFVNDERNKIKYPGIVEDKLFYKYFTKVRDSSFNSLGGKIRSEDYIFNVKALYDDLGYTKKINELNEKYKDRGINLVIPESDTKYYASESITFSDLPEGAKSVLYGAIFSGTYLYSEKIIDPEELMNLNSLQNSAIQSIQAYSYEEGTSSYTLNEELQKNSKNGQKIKSVDDIINNIDYKKAVNESSIYFEFVVSTKKTEKNIYADSSNDDLDSDSYKNNSEYVKTQEAIQKELDEKYSSITAKREASIYSLKSETPNKTYDYLDPIFKATKIN